MCSSDPEYRGEVDDLLWYFSFNYDVVQQFYKDRPEMTFRRIKDYIKYDAAAPPRHESEEGDDTEKGLKENGDGEMAAKRTRKQE